MTRLILTMLLLALPVVSFAVTLDATTNERKGNSGTTLTKSHTVTASGGNRAFYLLCAHRNLGYTMTATYAGAAMTEVRNDAHGSNNQRSYIFRKTNPATGANDWVMTQSTAVAAVCHGVSVTDVDQTTPETDSDGTCLASGDPSVTLTTATNELLLDVIGISSLSSVTPGANQTEIADIQTLENTLTVAASYQAGANGGVMSYGPPASTASCYTAVSIKHSAFSTANFGPLGRRR